MGKAYLLCDRRNLRPIGIFSSFEKAAAACQWVSDRYGGPPLLQEHVIDSIFDKEVLGQTQKVDSPGEN